MKLTVKTLAKLPSYTIGKMYIDGEPFCNTLEDAIRPDGVKIYGKTAIPRGTYKVQLTMSNRFKKVLPLLLDVPNFEGIRIHGGNTAEDTHGCILVGINDVKGKISNSQATLEKLMERLKGQSSIIIELL